MEIIFESTSGNWEKTIGFLTRAPNVNLRQILESLGQKGVRALAAATPKETSLAAESWYYEVIRTKGGWELRFSNSNHEGGFPVAVMLQYGHGTGTGGYVQGRDYINPALQPIFDEISEQAWKAVTSA